MTDRVKTLLLYASGPARWPAITRDTMLRGVLGLRDEDHLRSGSAARRLVLQALHRRFHYGSLSYMQDWHDAFRTSPELDVETCNANNLVEFARVRHKIREYPLVVVLHSVAGDSLSLLSRTESWFKERHGKLLVFLGNEYDLMPAKIGFLRSVEADYVGSQLPLAVARWLYAECDRSQILPAPHALNPQAYSPDVSSPRSIDIGFAGDIYHFFMGDIERTRTIQLFQELGPSLGLTCDIRAKRMPRAQWARFLNGCKGIIGAESGTYFLERTDQTKTAVQTYLKTHPQASFEEVFDRFFRDYPNPVSGKAISSRHFEPIGTQTCQILLEGRYNDILVADEHYLALKKDFSNIQDVVERFRDERYRMAMVQRTHDYVLTEHTYRHRVRSLVGAIFGI